MRRATLAVSIAIVGLCALSLPGSALARFGGNLCKVPTAGELAAGHVTASCTKVKSTRASSATPLGRLKTEFFNSYWGTGVTGPSHGLAIQLGHISGSAAVVSFARKRLGKDILKNGAPVGIGSVSSWHGSTSSCENPPTGDCTTITLEALVKNYELIVVFHDFPLTGVEELSPEDDAADLAQEETEKAPALAIAKTLAKLL
jgi:hypothetical protein